MVLETASRGARRLAYQRLCADRDRLVAFAFAGGNLLVEIDQEGRIRCAIGAVKSLTGLVAERWTGRPVHELFAADHQALVGRALAHLAQVSSCCRSRSPSLRRSPIPAPWCSAPADCRRTQA